MNPEKSVTSIASIVAGSAPALGPVRLRLVIAVAVLLLVAALGLFRGLIEPSSGWRFDADKQQRVQAIEIHGSGIMLDVKWIRGEDCQGTELVVPLDAKLMRETSGIAQYYSEHERFYGIHRQLWELLSCSVTNQKKIKVAHSQGEAVLSLSAKSISELGLRFWFPWAFALMAFSVGLAVWVYRPTDQSAYWYLLASACYCFWMMLVATMGSRLLSQPSFGLRSIHLVCHAAAHLYLICLCMLMWRFPSSLDSSRLSQRGVMWCMLTWASLSMLIDSMQWVPGINLGFRLPNLALAFVLAMLFVAQWRNSRGDPLRRAPLKWLGFLLLVTLSLAFFTTLFALTNQWTYGRMGYGLAFMSVIFLGFVPLVTRLKLFKLELWWARAWLWFLGGLMVVLLDVLLIRWLALDGGTALSLALALSGWVYFPLRQWLWRRFSQSALPATQEILPDIVNLTTRQSHQAHTKAWQALWEKHWQPQNLRVSPLVEVLGIQAQGQTMQIPALGPLPALELGMPLRGARLYNNVDLKRASEFMP
jgi:hypothetical protein